MSDSDTNQYLIFAIGSTNYAVELKKVQEIREFSEPTKIITSDPESLGVLNLRGNIIPIIDMRVLFGQAEAAFNPFTMIIMITFETTVIGFVVDKVNDVVQIEPGKIMAPPFEESIPHINFLGVVSHPTEGMIALVEILENK